jgi:hypothetical protein
MSAIFVSWEWMLVRQRPSRPRVHAAMTLNAQGECQMVRRVFKYASVMIVGLGLPAAAQEVAPQTVADALDMTSFRNSIGPRRAEGARTLADYGFVHSESEGNTAYYEDAEGGWRFSIGLISLDGKTATLCITDKAQNGGSYFTRKPLVAELDADGLYRASTIEPAVPECHL